MKLKPTYLLAALPLALAGCGAPENASSNTSSAPSNSASAGSSAQEAAHKEGHSETAASAMQADNPLTSLAFSSEPSVIPVGKPATWTLKITDTASGAPVQKFATVHDKLMHLIVVKKDLSWFNHIHPQLKQDGTFIVSTTLPSAGGYKLYADYTPEGQKQEVPQHEFAAGSAESSAAAPDATPKLVPDKLQGPWLIKRVAAHPEGEPDKKGGTIYEVAMMPMPSPLKAGQDSMLHFQVRNAKGQPIKDLQAYLGAMGHCVILSQDTTKYLHSHPIGGDMAGGQVKHDMSKMDEMKHEAPPKFGGPDVMFHTNFSQAGLYKAWGQFKHKGQIITAAFTVDVAAAQVSAASPAEGHSHTDGESHAH